MLSNHSWDDPPTSCHMLPREDKAHTRIGTEARTRRGNLDDLGSQDWWRSEMEMPPDPANFPGNIYHM